MQEVVLKVLPRKKEDGSPNRIRNAGFVPAVVYGHDIEGALALKVPARDLERIVDETIYTKVINLQIEELGQEYKVMVKEIQRDPIKDRILHADFYRFSLEEEIETVVPIHVEGEEKVESRGGILQFGLRELEIRCLPTRIPEVIEVDVSDLEIGDSIHVSDLKVPEGVEVISDPESVVVSVVAPALTAEEGEEAGAAETPEA
ncbi:MAG: large subunit ribosomal protein [Eubacteriales bacterium]|nr:large subunit ribosomal protein [Eubacteriales bacterium]MDN5364115.1 large subunit ribosomal protein [Eubacteriales bacterium]